MAKRLGAMDIINVLGIATVLISLGAMALVIILAI